MTDVVIDPLVVTATSEVLVGSDVSAAAAALVEVEVPTIVTIISEEPFVEIEEEPKVVIVASEFIETVVVEAGLPGPPGGGGGGADIFFSAMTAVSGIVGEIETDASGKHLRSAKTDSETVVVTLLVEGGQNVYQPTAIIGGIDAVVTETATKRIFQATATLSLAPGVNTIVATSSAGGADMLTVERLNPGPTVLSITPVPPVSPQTAYRAGQTAAVDIVTDDTAVSVTLLAYGACAGSITVPITSGQARISFTVSSAGPGATVRALATNDFGTPGTIEESSAVPIDQIVPNVALAVAYPVGQYAVKQGEEVTLATSAGSHESFEHILPAGLSGDTAFAASKQILCSSAAADATVAIQASLLKPTNASSATGSVNVRVVNSTPSLAVSIDGNPSRLTRSLLGTAYTVRVASSQPLMTLSIAGLTMTPQTGRAVWTGTLRVYDTTPPGDLVLETSATGAAGHTTSRSDTFTVGGFSSRTITWPAFSRVAPIGMNVYDQIRVAVSLGTKTLTRQNDAIDRPDGFYVADANGAYNPAGAYIALSDVAFAGSNTSGTLQGTVAES